MSMKVEKNKTLKCFKANEPNIAES